MQISALYRYPIKGCRGHAVDRLTIDRLGPVGDRRLMLVDSRGRFLSQREIARLATVVPTLEGDLLLATAPGIDPLRHLLLADGSIRSVSVWGSEGLQSIDQGDAAATWFSEAIGHPCRLVRFGAMTRNPIDPDFTPRADAETAFTDGYPVLAATEASLADLNARLAEPVPMERFRPNVVVSGASAWGEDDWRLVTIGETSWDAVKPCARCLVPTTDQVTGARHPQQEPLRTLATFRTRPGFGAIFGMNMVPRGEGVVHIGDPVTVA
jgi:uncharacterized protein YcbX